MCSQSPHKCYCGILYPCSDPNWLCSTINDDEDGHMCPDCYADMVDTLEDYDPLDDK